ncbi:ADP-ribosylglycohydrolase family protein [Carboxydochorda subterranea]|uniref:ADP-ribosylglycohydrolase family protein n=1 Tax=Carboxydichorda subterranea TaxID=3109565 RepID=A0ABZ1BX06_9FIRM|nr:ADP-ribosylglycohydrolase family protein [Limnochorda sp. L945t]WRP17312.1 ADP-ribosylglycohydrolase family protein [Limnochorda sp. L945t]
MLVAEEVRRYIASRHMEPGDPLPSEQELMRQLNVGRSSLREGLRALEYIGVITVVPGKGIFVRMNLSEQQEEQSMQEEELRELITEELTQLEQEGFDVKEARLTWDTGKRVWSPGELSAFFDRLQGLPSDPSFPYQEPQDFQDIQKTLPASAELPCPGDPDVLYDRIYGAWLGRVAGCMLGKPIEGWSRTAIRRYLEATGYWPPTDYLPYCPECVPEDFTISDESKRATKPYLDHGVRDDDLDYTVLGLRLLEEKGRGFTTRDVAQAWLHNLPYLLVYTAERMAYRNLVQGLVPPRTATYRNPFREWIGARIRADIYGLVNLGNPRLAAEMAYRDASLSHTKNGVYSAMFQAGCVAAALVADDIETIIRAGMSQVPEQSRTMGVVREFLQLWRSGRTWEEACDHLYRTWGHYHWVHSLNNLAAELIGLLWGQGDFTQAVSIAVMCGLDTDCNGASVGTIIGGVLGAARLPSRWTSPLNDRLETALQREPQCRISELARRTLVVAQQR